MKTEKRIAMLKNERKYYANMATAAGRDNSPIAERYYAELDQAHLMEIRGLEMILEARSLRAKAEADFRDEYDA